MSVLEQRRKRYERLAASTAEPETTDAFYDVVDAAARSLPENGEQSVHTWFAALVENTVESIGNPENTALDHVDDSLSDWALLSDQFYLTTATTAAWAFAGASLQALPPDGEADAREAVAVLLRKLADLATDATTADLPVEHVTTANCTPGRVARALVDAGARDLPAEATRADMGQIIASWLPLGYHRATADRLDESQLPIRVLTSVAEELADLSESAPRQHLAAIAAALEKTAGHLPARDPAAEGRLHRATSRIYRACGQTMLAQQSLQERGRLRQMFGG